MKVKTAPALLMYLAYFIILAHAVIPHHHHDSVLCLQTVSAIHNQCCHDQCASEHTAHEECKLTQSEVLPAKSINGQIPYSISMIIDIQVNIYNPVPNCPSRIDYPFPDKGINSHYLKYASESSILRAPPTA